MNNYDVEAHRYTISRFFVEKGYKWNKTAGSLQKQ